MADSENTLTIDKAALLAIVGNICGLDVVLQPVLEVVDKSIIDFLGSSLEGRKLGSGNGQQVVMGLEVSSRESLDLLLVSKVLDHKSGKSLE